MKIIKTETLIQSDSARVWDILTDFENFPNWNPFIFKISGTLKAGEKLQVQIKVPQGSNMNFTPIIQNVFPTNQLVWRGKFLFKGLFDGEHFFALESIGENTRFVHTERFSGILVPLLPKSFFQKIKNGFEAMNLALKMRAEEE